MDTDPKAPTVAELLAKLGVDNPGNNHDDAIRWALLELDYLRSEHNKFKAVARKLVISLFQRIQGNAASC